MVVRASGDERFARRAGMSERTAANMSAPRCVLHIDLDAFYAQCESKRDPSLKGVPLGVVQYNPFEPGGVKNVAIAEPRLVNDGNGSIIALSYEARARGVKRGMRGEEARRICPEMQLIQVPTSHQKADLTLYRDEGKRVIDVLLRRVALVERASIDEAYLDVTAEADKLLREQGLRACCAAAAGTHVGGVEDMPEAKLSQNALRRGHTGGGAGEEEECTPPEALSAAWLSRPAEYWTKEEAALVAGAALAKTLREDVRAQLGHTCSAGVAPNKLLAKLATGLRKPDAQTLLPPASTAALLRDLPLARLRGLGGAFGAQVAAELRLTTVGELAAVPLQRLQARFGEERGAAVHALAHGRSDEPVKDRGVPLSIGCSKTFRGGLALRSIADVAHWLRELAGELEERLAEDKVLNARTPKQLTVQVSPATVPGFSASCPLRPGASVMAEDATALVRRWQAGQPVALEVVSMGLRAGNFEADAKGVRSITDFMAPADTSITPASVAPPAAAAAASPTGLRRFFQRSEVQAGDAAAGEGGPTMTRCSRCGREVAAGREADEHADFHFAQELSRQEQRAAPPAKRAKTGPLDALLRPRK